jgi:UDP-N-acetyl-2-amino-2-deoxyglucuronate dehydrogenase
MEKVRIGIVGMGVQGTNYARMLVNKTDDTKAMCPPYAELAAICDNDDKALAKAKAAFPEAVAFSDYEELIDSGEIDAVITTVPHYLHPPVAVYALEHGTHVLIEKPAGIDAKSVKYMNKVAKDHPDLVFGVMLNQRTNTLYQKIKDVIDSGRLGEIRRVNWIINSWWRSTAYYNQSAWRATWGGEGGGVLVNQAPHQLDLIQWLCGVPSKVYAKMIFGAHRDIVVENDVTMTLTYPNGATGVFVTCTHDIIGTDRLEIDLSQGKIVVDNSREATIYTLAKDEDVLDKETTPEDVHRMVASNQSGNKLFTEETIKDDGMWGFQHIEVIDRFTRQIVTGEGLLADGSEGLLGVNLANAAFLSAWTGEEVSYPLDDDLFLEKLNEHIAKEGKWPLHKALGEV